MNKESPFFDLQSIKLHAESEMHSACLQLRRHHLGVPLVLGDVLHGGERRTRWGADQEQWFRLHHHFHDSTLDFRT